MDTTSRGTSHLPHGSREPDKAGKGFFKLNNDIIAAVCEDLVAEYQALAD